MSQTEMEELRLIVTIIGVGLSTFISIISLIVSWRSYKKASEPEKEKNAIKKHLGMMKSAKKMHVSLKTEFDGSDKRNLVLDDVTNNFILLSDSDGHKEVQPLTNVRVLKPERKQFP